MLSERRLSVRERARERQVRRRAKPVRRLLKARLRASLVITNYKSAGVSRGRFAPDGNVATSKRESRESRGWSEAAGNSASSDCRSNQFFFFFKKNRTGG